MSRRGLFLGIALFGTTFLTAADAPRGSLEIFFIDVQGGAATLIVTPEKESILIDSGWPGLDDRDPKRIEHVLKDVAGLDHLDQLVTTHWHTDHYGGVAGLAKRVRIDHFWDRGLPDLNAPGGDKAEYPDGPKSDDPMGIAYRKASEGKRRALQAGDVIRSRGKVEILVVASGGRVIRKQGPVNPACDNVPPDLPVDGSDNARSLALKFTFGRFDFLDCGDLTWNIEKQLVCPVDQIGAIDLYQVTHHGMAISNHPTLVQTIAPTVAVMNNGPRKGGDAAAVARLLALPSLKALYQLHKNAATPPSSNTDPALIANSDPAGGQFIRATVTPDGAHFEVRIGADGPARTFEAR
jgi:competence protein ComEC